MMMIARMALMAARMDSWGWLRMGLTAQDGHDQYGLLMRSRMGLFMAQDGFDGQDGLSVTVKT